MRLITLVALTIVMFGCGGGYYAQQDEYVPPDISKEGFAKKITVKDDSLETKAEINTVNGYRWRDNAGGLYNDSFLRAYIDKKTGDTVYQVYDIVYLKDWSYFHSVNYKIDGDIRTKDLIKISHDVISCSSLDYIGCTLREDVAWEVERSQLDSVAGMYTTAEDREMWEYRLKAKEGSDVDNSFFTAEVAAFLEAVDAYKEKNSLK